MITPEILEWMNHGYQIACSLLKYPHVRTPEQYAQTRQEISIREFVLAHLHEDLEGAAAIWREWMIYHAQLQIQRYSYQITETEFRDLAMAGLHNRDRQLIQVEPLESQIIKAITLWQPYASLIAHGLKKFETRSWKTNYRGLLGIHASKRWTKSEKRIVDQLYQYYPQTRIIKRFPLGEMLCVVNLVECHRSQDLVKKQGKLERSVGDWSPGRYVWELDLVEVFKKPIAIGGSQGLWDWERIGA